MLMRLHRQELEQIVMKYESYRGALVKEMEKRKKENPGVQQQQIGIPSNVDPLMQRQIIPFSPYHKGQQQMLMQSADKQWQDIEPNSVSVESKQQSRPLQLHEQQQHQLQQLQQQQQLLEQQQQFLQKQQELEQQLQALQQQVPSGSNPQFQQQLQQLQFKAHQLMSQQYQSPQIPPPQQFQTPQSHDTSHDRSHDLQSHDLQHQQTSQQVSSQQNPSTQLVSHSQHHSPRVIPTPTTQQQFTTQAQQVIASGTTPQQLINQLQAGQPLTTAVPGQQHIQSQQHVPQSQQQPHMSQSQQQQNLTQNVEMKV